jgi:hypothetical protein
MEKSSSIIHAIINAPAFRRLITPKHSGRFDLGYEYSIIPELSVHPASFFLIFCLPPKNSLLFHFIYII